MGLCGTAAIKQRSNNTQTALQNGTTCDKTLLSQPQHFLTLYMWPIYTGANCAFHACDNCKNAALSVASIVLERLCTGKRLVKER